MATKYMMQVDIQTLEKLTLHLMDEMSSKQHETHPDRKIILIFGKKNLEIL